MTPEIITRLCWEVRNRFRDEQEPRIGNIVQKYDLAPRGTNPMLAWRRLMHDIEAPLLRESLERAGPALDTRTVSAHVVRIDKKLNGDET